MIWTISAEKESLDRGRTSRGLEPGRDSHRSGTERRQSLEAVGKRDLDRRGAHARHVRPLPGGDFPTIPPFRASP